MEICNREVFLRLSGRYDGADPVINIHDHIADEGFLSGLSGARAYQFVHPIGSTMCMYNVYSLP